MPVLAQKITAAIAGMRYISESEAPLELLEWPGIQTLQAAQQKAATLGGTRQEEEAPQSTEAFLQPIRQMAVPEDAVMTAYAKQWTELIKKLERWLKNVRVITTPAKGAMQQLYIVGFTDDGALAVHTTAIAT